MPSAETLRTFVALPLHDTALIERLDSVQRRLQRECPYHTVRWVDSKAIHLTLFFLGDIIAPRRAPIETALKVVADVVRPFEFQVKGLGVFPSSRRPKIIWAGVHEPTGQLKLLHRAVNEALEHVGFEPDSRRFKPHMTLGRIRRRVTRADAAIIGHIIERTDLEVWGEDTAREIVFFQSVLTPQGAEYTALARFPLGG